MSEKTKAQLLAEELFYKKKSAFETMSEEDKAAAFKYADEYSEYLYNSKTEREAVAASIATLNILSATPSQLAASTTLTAATRHFSLSE